MVEYFIETCPKCKSHNWMYKGDPSDLTFPDIEGIECWNCHHKWIPDCLSIELDNEYDCVGGEDDEEYEYVDYTLGKLFAEVRKAEKC